jgi:hypothetical protein
VVLASLRRRRADGHIGDQGSAYQVLPDAGRMVVIFSATRTFVGAAIRSHSTQGSREHR